MVDVFSVVMFLISIVLIISGIIFATMSYIYNKKANSYESRSGGGDYKTQIELSRRYQWIAIFTLPTGFLILYAVLRIFAMH